MEKEIYLNFAVYNKDGIDYIVNVMDGYAASDAWKVSDEAYSKIAGRSFFGLFGDDGKCVCCDKGQVRRITSKEEYDRLHKFACLTFKQMEKTFAVMERILSEYPFADWRDKVRAQQEMHCFTFYGHGMFDHPLLNINPEDPNDDEKFEQLAKITLKLK